VPLGNASTANRSETTPRRGTDEVDGPIVVLNWTDDGLGLVDALALAAPRASGPSVICVGARPSSAVAEAAIPDRHRGSMRYVQAPRASDDVVGLARVLADDVDVASARSIIVRPDPTTQEPDANSRVTCVAVKRACGSNAVPNILVEVQDPEAAYEFAGLGVATVFYPGYLRAALLAHACVDLGVFQFVYGLLRGRYRVRLLPMADDLRDATFLDAVARHEADGEGNAITIIGIQVVRKSDDTRPDGNLLINPGPRRRLTDAVALLALGEA
jgi:hypothetical protein